MPLFLFQSVCPAVYREIYTPVLYKPITIEDVKWNFEKFLIGPDGRPIYRYAMFIDPRTSTQLKSDIAAEMAKLKSGTGDLVG